MKDFKKNLKSESGEIIFTVFELVVGILLLTRPVEFTSGIIRVAGIVLMLWGVYQIVRYFRMNAMEASMGHSLAMGLILLLFGGFCTFYTDWFLVTFPVLSIIYGVFLLVAGLGKVQKAVDMLRWKNPRWWMAALNAVVSIVCAVVILGNPFETMVVLWKFIGVTIIVEGVLDVIIIIVANHVGKGSIE